MNIKNILSNHKSNTKISKINPSDREISHKITVQNIFEQNLEKQKFGIERSRKYQMLISEISENIR